VRDQAGMTIRIEKTKYGVLYLQKFKPVNAESERQGNAAFRKVKNRGEIFMGKGNA